MSRKGDLAPLRLTRTEATLIARLIVERAGRYRLEGTPFEALPEFADCISKAARRSRRGSSDLITMWSVPRPAATAAFHYLALFAHPDASELLEGSDFAIVQAVALVLASSLTERRGAERLSALEVEERMEAWRQRQEAHRSRDGDAQSQPDTEPDERFLRRLAARERSKMAMAAILMHAMPPGVRALLAP